MLKRNLIIVVVISLSVFLTSNAFGQNTKRKTAKKAKVVAPTTSTPPADARVANPNPSGFVYEKIRPNTAGTPPTTPTGNNSAREAGSGTATGLVNEVSKVKVNSTPTPKARKSTKRKKP